MLLGLLGCVNIQTSGHSSKNLDSYIDEIVQKVLVDTTENTTTLLGALSEFHSHQGHWPETPDELNGFLISSQSRFSLTRFSNIQFSYTEDGSLLITYDNNLDGNSITYKLSFSADDLAAIESLITELTTHTE